jgi:peptide chain release factor subunit 1
MEPMEQIEEYQFKKKLEELQSDKGRATELISLYIPPNKEISDVTSYLKEEISQSSNIKSKSTRKNVTSAIESLISRLRYYRRPPENGVALFVGHKAIGADQTAMVAHIIFPPKPIQSYIYRCDSQFFLDPLKEMLGEEKVYGLLVIDRREATIGFLRGERIELAEHLTSLVPGKHGRGGQSQRRFERLIEQAASEFFKKSGEKASTIFLNEKNLESILIGGPGSTKEYFLQGGYLHYEVAKKVLDPTFDTGYTDEYGLKELVNNAQGVLQETKLVKEKNLVKRLMNEAIKDDGLAVYGEDEVRAYLDHGALDTILVSEDLNKEIIEVLCKQCGNRIKKTAKKGEDSIMSCPNCGAPMEIGDRKDLIEALLEESKKKGTKIELISKDTEEGEILAKGFGGIAAIARFKVSKI